MDHEHLAFELSLWTGAAVGGRNAGRERISELAKMGLSLRVGPVSKGKKSQAALCGLEEYTYVIVLNFLESEEKL